MTWLAYLTGAILALQPALEPKQAQTYAQFVQDACTDTTYKAIIAIISVESSFMATKVSKTGDIGLAQVNLRVWGPVFKTTAAELLNPEYNIRVACTILNLVQIKHGSKSDWIGFYHSRHAKPRAAYMRKINRELRRLDANLSRQ